MNKKVVGGLLGILFVTSMVQTSAILKMQNIANAPRTQSVAMTPVEEHSNYYNQQAAVGTLNTTPSDPAPQGYILYIGTDNRIHCAYSYGGVLWYYGTVQGSGNATDINSFQGCVGAGPTPFISGSGGLNIELSSSKTSFNVSGGTTPVMQFKLFLLGYLDISQVTGKLDATTKSALISFQKNRGLSQTGTYGPQTQAALDSVISAISKFNVASGTNFTFTK